jgi:Holliday junction DNA helicase RuvA
VIAFVDGVVDGIRDGSLIVRVGGVGLEAHVPASTVSRAKLGSALRLHTQLVVREDAWTLYGFDEPDGLRWFNLLVGVSGVGPKLALAVLSALPRAVIAAAVVNDDPLLLAAAPGVGKRTAERIVLDLKSRLPEDLIAGADTAASAPRTQGSPLGPEAQDAVEALIALGYREANVRATLIELAGNDPEASAEALIRKALSRLR